MFKVDFCDNRAFVESEAKQSKHNTSLSHFIPSSRKDYAALEAAHKSSLTVSFCLFECMSEVFSESAAADGCVDSAGGIPDHRGNEKMSKHIH